MKKRKSQAISSARGAKDPVGQAIRLFWKHSQQESYEAAEAANYLIDVQADKLDDDVIPVKHLFRDFDSMPLLEQKALELTQGKTLDIGAAAGCHSLYLQAKGIDVTPIDISPGAVDVMKERGLNAQFADIFKYKVDVKFNTVLALMNGLGIAGTEAQLPQYLQALKSLLADGGQILIDSSDLGEFAEDFSEIRYQMHFKNSKSKIFPWLFLTYERFEAVALEQGFKVEQVYADKDGSYLVKLS
ncbi:MAG TPA: SAM-dependent methyltransferase [Gammaproteobacteria bacterium]|nr:SAM-dependent methyltransferase [Gammaproteobacteria bacterium]MEC8011764.1 class I SAM-dependent methyltransferase [Pseudomonadota bacterium]HBF08515.1 SAM-dependent methyltransferase [Gammaproteobacteria bacterium]HCK92501.1 SAM-dependent methyltransferase [Gammaproteobacteria bacterium]|tara:strand:- start:418 stop:1149 length:732 start_codon:yes stop_codon:yes gene_type:complete